MKLKCVIIDDEPRAHNVLQHYIDKISTVELVGTARNVMEAYELLKHQPADLLLLDINMPELDGFSLIEMMEKPPMVIIVTAYTEHAFKSYDYGAIDYLHKPIRFERFVKAVEKAVKWKDVKVDDDTEIELKIDNAKRKISLADICYIESIGNYCKICLKTKKLVTLIALKELEQRLPKPSFLRIHKSYIINMNMVSELRELSMMIQDVELPIGKTYKKYIEEHVNRNK